MPIQANRLLVKLRGGTALRAAEARSGLRPLYDAPRGRAAAFSVGGEPQWYLADLPEGAATPWDQAHARVAAQLGVAEEDVLFAEPDLVHDVFPDESASDVQARFGAVGAHCEPVEQDGQDGRATGPGIAWHLGDGFSQLARARSAVVFADPRTRIGHLDTGYYAAHVTRPAHLLTALQRNFVERDHDPGNAEDPDNHRWLLDNSGHGTGTLGILAGGPVPALGDVSIGGAPDAEVLPLRIADSVVLLRTSAFARALRYALLSGCDVVSMSMGGLPSQAWREGVDDAYLAGLCVVTAAGNNVGGFPTRRVVYPARYSRVLAACGVMADGRPYTGLQHRTMEGNYGPRKVMSHALGAYTPNIPWAVFGCPDLVRLDGCGTSAATPQIAAAAALWLEKYKHELPRDWRRIEAVRHALFTTARKAHPDELGQGILQAHDALGIRPSLHLPQMHSEGDSFAFLRVLTGLGIGEPAARERMLDLELAQRWLVNERLQEIVPDPDDAELDDAARTRFMEAVLEDDGASLTLRRHVAARYPVVAGTAIPRTALSHDVVPERVAACDAPPSLVDPPYRRLRAYAVDPSISTRLSTAAMNEVTLEVRWEALPERGPVGEYVAVDDVDASGQRYEGVLLDDPRLLARDGWAPSEGNPQFHQQMVYAVAMKTIGHFERALGRPVLWRHGHDPADELNDGVFVPRLSLRPHALREANAFYSPQEIALLFGYFESEGDDPGDHVPGSRVYTCLSHDIVAHETTHAVLDGMHRRFHEPTNPDVLAFHEAFADIVALLQHFTMPEVLAHEIGRTRGDIEAESLLGSLAVQLGRARGGRGALRDAIGRMEEGVWRRLTPDPLALQKRRTPHGRGAILVAAVFDAFLAIYKARSADLMRIGTGGTGVLPAGAIHPDLVGRLTDEATTAAAHVLDMCIAALDYLPPVDVTFFEYLRALITADFDLVRDDRHDYRVAFVEAFRRRGIHPAGLGAGASDALRTMSVDTLRWQGLDYSRLPAATQAGIAKQYGVLVARLKRHADQCLYLRDRETLFARTRAERRALHDELRRAFEEVPAFAVELGLDPTKGFEVHELRPAMRIGRDGRYAPQVVVALTQSKKLDQAQPFDAPGNRFRGGSTLVIDLVVPEVRYRVLKDIESVERQARTAAFVRESLADPLRALFFRPQRREPFAALHALAHDGV